MSSNQLILLPRDPARIPSSMDALLATLQKNGFIGAALTDKGTNCHRPGENFLEQIIFLGCSPVVALGEPGCTSDEFCYLELDGPHPEPRFLAGKNCKPPRCPACRHTFGEVGDWLRQWQEQLVPDGSCPACGKPLLPQELDWRQSAGFGRFFLRVHGIFEGEAVASDGLLATLQQATGLEWRSFYYRPY